MLYFAYGSNLNHKQMEFRCKGSVFIKKYILNDYDFCFSHVSKKNKYGHANIFKSKGYSVPGAIWNISKLHENALDKYEGVDYDYYKKEYLTINEKKVLVYIQNPFFKKTPNSTYFHIILEGYKNCKIDIDFLKKKIKDYRINHKIDWQR